MSKKPSFFVIWNPEGCRPPSFRHMSYGQAASEAQRLARQSPTQSFYVMEARLLARVPDPVQVEEFETLEEIPF